MQMKAFQLPSTCEVRFTTQPSGCERPHTHSSLIISAVTGGNISLQVNAETIKLKEGVVAAIGSDILHCIKSFSKKFNGVYVLELFNIPAFCHNFNLAHLQLFNSMIITDKTKYYDYIILCERLLSSIDTIEKSKLLSLWVHALLSSYYSSFNNTDHSHHLLAEKIRNQLDAHEGESAPFDAISESCNYSKEHCNRVFKQAYNISMQAYFLNKKAHKARELLKSKKPLSDIALECGFYDQSHFSNIFKDIFQITPAKYRSIIS